MKLFGRTRMLIGVILILCLGMAFVIPVRAESNPPVMMFEVQGNSHVPVEKILGVIANTTIGEPLEASSVQLDMQAIMSLGYFADVHANTEKMANGVKLIFEVIENPIFKELQITGLTKLKPEELKTYFSQKSGEVFNTVTFKESLSKALKFCQEKKGLYVEPQTPGISADGVVKLKLIELKYGKITILGLVKTQEVVVRRELSIKEGDIIDANILKEECLNIMRLRLFDGLEPRFEQSENSESLDLVIEVKEAQTGSFSFGFSYSETTQEFGGLLGYSEANLMGFGQSMSLDLNFGESSRNLQFSFQEPWLDSNHTFFGLSMWNADSSISSTMNRWILDPNARYDLTNPNTPANPSDPKYNDPNHQNTTGESDYIPYTDLPTYYGSVYDIDLMRTGLSLSLGRNIWKDVTGKIILNFEKNQVKSFWVSGSDESAASIPSSNPVFNSGLLEFWDNSAELELVQNKLNYQDRNFVDGGYQLLFDNTWAGKYLGGTFNYYKAVAEGKWFHSFTPSLVIGTRLQGAVIMGDYPDYDRLYLGGMYKLRGYDDRRYYNSSTSQLIGTEYLLSNTELRYRVATSKGSNKDLEFVLFYDAGQMTENGIHTLKSDYGVGLRYNIPFLGVIRLDQAWNVDGDARLVFSLGEIF